CNFPTQTPITGFFQRIADEGLCQSGWVKRLTLNQDDGEEEEQCFWLKNDTRAEVLQNAIRDSGRGLSYLQREMSDIGAGILRAQTQSIAAPEAIARWAELAAKAQNPYYTAELLGKKVEDSLSRKEPGELLRWIEAARPIEELLKGNLSTTIARASRRL